MTNEEWEREAQRLRAIKDPFERIKAVQEVQAVVKQDMDDLITMRAAALLEAIDSGLTQAEIAEQLGVSPGRVSQMVNDPRSPRKRGKPPQP